MRDPYNEMIEMIPELRQKFLAASADYGDAFKELGLAGQYSDMHRKMKKLKRAMWDGVPLTRESAEEVLGDLFGHILISLYLLRHEDDDQGGGVEDSIPVEPEYRMPNADGRLGAELTPTFTTMAVDQSDGTLISSIEQFKRIFGREPSDEERDGMAEDVRRARAREAQLNSEGANAPDAVERGATVWEGDNA